jgi:conjugal transfer/entry exclusion protein
MTDEELKTLSTDPDGLQTYEYIANNIGKCDDDLDRLVDNLRKVDLTGQFMASAARYLNAIDAVRYGDAVRNLVAATIDRDREHRYIGDLMQSLYGENYAERAAELSATDNNFRRMYKRLFPEGLI